jgi:hypothetical protein
MSWRCGLEKEKKNSHITLVETPLYEELTEKSKRRLGGIIKINKGGYVVGI